MSKAVQDILPSVTHLTYCTNIHGGESWAEHFEQIKENFPDIKLALNPDEVMGIGLRLSNTASIELLEGNNLQEFKDWLLLNNACVFTMNGFPYGQFHSTVVKSDVHSPDWTTTERVDYTIRLIKILAELLPEGMDGGISTSPLSYKYWHHNEKQLDEVTSVATQNILKVAKVLIETHQTQGKLIHLDIEPEPDGLIENGPEFIDWFKNVLLVKGVKFLSELSDTQHFDGESLIKEHIRLCYDICHFAIGYEDHSAMLLQFNQIGIKVGKVQISAALKVILPEDLSARKEIAVLINKYNEPTYLHQVVALTKENELIRYRDLPQALADIFNTDVLEWRIHFHIPLFTDSLGKLGSTQSDVTDVLNLFKSNSFTNHLEVETYTWDVLPTNLKVPLKQSIIRELNWVADHFKHLSV
ncbi:metabolite traffic protein EboE [Mucilaginibacter agri]|uniref:Metabolite traffic protein EboE n=1 Tax=Mucilaginibacter agri TaxID=2695265 RepID=A0A966DV27_9SPHI|nr:metabolite traffic protein EboE [Mucilaginibacter agri]NCD72415.1 metabolite traffic protein EboE [Mucilaginibacter agri]